jgi:hypothetical protein
MIVAMIIHSGSWIIIRLGSCCGGSTDDILQVAFHFFAVVTGQLSILGELRSVPVNVVRIPCVSFKTSSMEG